MTDFPTMTVRGLFVRGARPRWLWLVVPVTLLYLALEFSFSAALLDVIGGTPDDARVRAIEHWGRLLSGFALALVAWPWLLERARRRHWSDGKRLLALTAVSLAAMVGVYRFQAWLDDTLVDRSSAAERQVALNLGLLQRGLAERLVVLADFEVAPEVFGEPEGKAFLGLFPLLAFSQEQVGERLRPQREAIVRAVVVKRGGGLEAHFNRFVDSLRQMRDDYNNGYVPAYNRYVETINGIEARQRDAWNEYVGKLRRRGWVRGGAIRVPGAYWARVRRDVRNAGVPVSGQWAPHDRAGFHAALARRIEDQAAAALRKGVREAYPGIGDIPPGSSFKSLAARDDVQALWREKLGYPEPGTVAGQRYRLPASLPVDTQQALAEFERAVYEPVVTLLARQALAPYLTQLDALGDGQPQEPLGRSAYRRMIVPPLALAFSLLGALVHVLKSGLYLLQVFAGVTFRNGAVKAAALLVLSLLAFLAAPRLVDSTVAGQPLYRELLDKVRRLGPGDDPTAGGRLLAAGIDGAIHLEKIGYPVFAAARRHVLRGYDFSDDPLP